MPQLQLDLSEWFVEIAFISAIIFAVIYIPFYKWRETLTGKAVTVLILAIAGALFRPVLLIWHVIHYPKGNQSPGGFWNDCFTWLSIVSLAAAGAAIIALIFEMLRGIFSESENKWICRLLMLGRKFSDDK